MSDRWAVQTKRCAEDIALLFLVTSTPSPPTTNPLIQHPDRDGPRILSLDRECRLAGSLAFLAGISDNPNHVVALSVGESERGLRVVLAINQQRHGDARDILAQIRLGLLSLFRTLASPGRDIDAVLSTVIQMTRDRILQRIGSRHAGQARGNRCRKSFAGTTQTVLDAVWTSLHLEDVKPFIQKASTLKRCLDDVEQSPPGEIDGRLKELVLLSSGLSQTVDVSRLLRGISSRVLNPNLAEGFVHRLEKLARYHESSRFLNRMAAKADSDAFGNADVVPVSLSAKSFSHKPLPPDDASLPSCVSRCQDHDAHSKTKRRGLRVPIRPAAFQEAASHRSRDSKIHAEIQVLAHHELYPSATPPRVICSSKSACYLCDAFVRLHGKFAVPSSHGRLYPAWRLPKLPDSLLQPLEDLNRFLEAQIASVALGPPSHLARVTTYPNESALLPLTLSASTIAGVEEHEPEVRPTYGEANGPQEPSRISDPPPISNLGSSSSTSTARPPLEAQTVPFPPADKETEMPPSASEPSSVASAVHPVSEDPGPTAPRRSCSVSPLPLPDSDVVLTRGQFTSWISSGSGNVPRSFSAGNLTIVPELPRPLPPFLPPPDLGFRVAVEWLGDGEARRARDNVDSDSVAVFDVSDLPADVDVDSGSRECVVLACGDDVVRITVERAGRQEREAAARSGSETEVHYMQANN